MSEADEVCYEDDEEILADEVTAADATVSAIAPTVDVDVKTSSPPSKDMIVSLLADPRVGYHTPKPTCQAMMYGWFWPAHQIIFECLLSDKTQVIIELGSFFGKSTSFLLTRCPNALVFAVDIWDNDHLKNDSDYKYYN
jgi:hypothetical protein